MILKLLYNEQPEKKMKKTGLYDQIGQDHFFPHTNHAIAYALEHINKNHCSTCQKINGNECVLDK
ncbi:MAG: sulfate transporter [Firmicutes bacterium]|nr:sulfate transporter [Bacillota bacterium]